MAENERNGERIGEVFEAQLCFEYIYILPERPNRGKIMTKFSLGLFFCLNFFFLSGTKVLFGEKMNILFFFFLT